MDQPVVRNRLAKCGADLEALWSWIESFVYQMCHLKKAENRDTQGSHGCKDTRGLRGRYAGLGRTTTCEELPKENAAA